MIRKGCELSIHGHDIDLSLTIVGLLDAPDSDQDDFR